MKQHEESSLKIRKRHPVATLGKGASKQTVSKRQALQCILSTMLQVVVWLPGIRAISLRNTMPLDPVNQLVEFAELAILVCSGGIIHNAFYLRFFILSETRVKGRGSPASPFDRYSLSSETWNMLCIFHCFGSSW